MFNFSKVALAGVALALGMFMAGCNTAPQSSLVPAMAGMPSSQGVMCSKCKIVYVKVPVENGKYRIISYSEKKEDMCPDCMDAVTAFFNTGKLQHTCKTCGETLSICEAHAQP